MNAFVFASGESLEPKINGASPAFLPLEDRPLLLYVLMALDRVETIQKITVVGPQKEVMRAVESMMFVMPFQKPIAVLEPKETLLESIAAAQGAENALKMIAPPALYLPGNIPFVTTAEISTFLADADMGQSDVCVAYAADGAFDFLGPAQNEISAKFKTACPTKEGRVHFGRLFLARPGQMGGRGALQTLFARSQSTKADSAETTAFLKTRVGLIETKTGGHALPVQDAGSYRFITDHFAAWRRQITELKSEAGEKICSISGTVCDSEKTNI